MAVNIKFEKERNIKRVSFLITRKPLGIILDIILLLFCSILLIKLQCLAKLGILIMGVYLVLCLFPKKKVIEHNLSSKKLIIRQYLGKFCMSYSGYILNGPRWMYKPQTPLWGNKKDKFYLNFWNKKYNYFNANPWAVNLPNKKEADKISRFLELNLNYGVPYL